MKKLTYTILLFISLTACGKKPKEDKSKTGNAPAPPTVVDVMIASQKLVSNAIDVNGTVLPNEQIDIHAEVSGRLTYLNIPEGNAVSAGTVLAKINDADLQAQLSKQKVQLDLATKTEQRLKKLLSINGINQADYDLALSTVNNTKADIEITKAQIDKTIIKAPFNGVIGLRNVSPGAYITPQTSLATLQQLNKSKIDFSVPEQYAHLIAQGKNIAVATDYNKNTYTATIVATEPEINNSTRNLKARAVLNDCSLHTGSFVKVKIATTAQNTKSIFVPTNAIIPDADNKKLVIVKNGVGKYVPVETGVRTASMVEIIKGLEIGDSVVVTGVLFVKPNGAVKVKKVIEENDSK